MARKAAYNGYLAERRVELADGTWKISEDGIQVEIPGATTPFAVLFAVCCVGPSPLVGRGRGNVGMLR